MWWRRWLMFGRRLWVTQDQPDQKSNDIDCFIATNILGVYACDPSLTKKRVEDVTNSIRNAKPIGVVIRISGDGENTRSHYNALGFCGHTYKIKDTVLLAHDPHGQMNKPWVFLGKGSMNKPWVAIIKDITGMKNENIMVYVQWFYRPSEIFIEKCKCSHSLKTYIIQDWHTTSTNDPIERRAWMQHGHDLQSESPPQGHGMTQEEYATI
ncbi:bromo adjacent homology (BAH) domain protein [Artemisia annua]|uniref:Bromo adjacent homology (BAH) domain protein n=1 Tax=Artemisia annua TaxID=35608 RepID=A0A2U1KQ53_ARTAN|nr:bromo adjacent homology (BAH) domain protein [Artemisia annua]